MYITNVIYQTMLEAQASELSSRMTAMSAATNNAEDMIKTLTVQYNKVRQEGITQELTEVIGASMKKQVYVIIKFVNVLIKYVHFDIM